MNLHPLFVHFPIACLSIYTILEVITMFVPRLNDKLLMTKKILLFIGAAFAFISLQTGEQAQALRGKSTLIHTHEEFAEKAYMTYVVIAVIYILQWLSTSNAGRVIFSQKNQDRVAKILTAPYMRKLIGFAAIIGFALLSITGALGGAITHGVNSDPMVGWVVDIFVK